MITVGIIKEKRYNNDTLMYLVDLSVFKFPGVINSPINNTEIEATVCVEPGTYEPYKTGDKVYIGFVNNDLGQPVILGKIAQKFDEREDSTVYQYINSLQVTSEVELPKSFKLGDFTYQDLYDTIIYVRQKKQEEGE